MKTAPTAVRASRRARSAGFHRRSCDDRRPAPPPADPSADHHRAARGSSSASCSRSVGNTSIGSTSSGVPFPSHHILRLDSAARSATIRGQHLPPFAMSCRIFDRPYSMRKPSPLSSSLVRTSIRTALSRVSHGPRARRGLERAGVAHRTARPALTASPFVRAQHRFGTLHDRLIIEPQATARLRKVAKASIRGTC
jgi:hypothetical protein